MDENILEYQQLIANAQTEEEIYQHCKSLIEYLDIKQCNDLDSNFEEE